MDQWVVIQAEINEGVCEKSQPGGSWLKPEVTRVLTRRPVVVNLRGTVNAAQVKGSRRCARFRG